MKINKCYSPKDILSGKHTDENKWCGYDLRDMNEPVTNMNGTYSTHLYTQKAIDVINSARTAGKVGPKYTLLNLFSSCNNFTLHILDLWCLKVSYAALFHQTCGSEKLDFKHFFFFWIAYPSFWLYPVYLQDSRFLSLFIWPMPVSGLGDATSSHTKVAIVFGDHWELQNPLPRQGGDTVEGLFRFQIKHFCFKNII